MRASKLFLVHSITFVAIAISIAFYIPKVALAVTPVPFDSAKETTENKKGISGALKLFQGVSLNSGFKADALTKTPEQIVGEIIKAALILIGVIFGGLVIYAGYLWMIARGNEEMATRAKTILENAAIGIIIVAGAYAITSFIVNAVLNAAY